MLNARKINKLIVVEQSSRVNKKTSLSLQCFTNDFSTALNKPKIKSFGYVKPPLDFKLTNSASGLLE